MYDVPVAARLTSASVRTFDGPDPKRPSLGSSSAGSRISVGAGAPGAATVSGGVTHRA